MIFCSGHRFRTVCEFGLISLDIVTVYPEDSGKYEARVTNASGSVSSSVSIQVEGHIHTLTHGHTYIEAEIHMTMCI